MLPNYSAYEREGIIILAIAAAWMCNWLKVTHEPVLVGIAIALYFELVEHKRG